MAQQARGELSSTTAARCWSQHWTAASQLVRRSDRRSARCAGQAGRSRSPPCARWCSPVRVTDGSSATLTSGGCRPKAQPCRNCPARRLSRAADGTRRRPRPHSIPWCRRRRCAVSPNSISAQHLPADEQQRSRFHRGSQRLCARHGRRVRVGVRSADHGRRRQSTSSASPRSCWASCPAAAAVNASPIDRKAQSTRRHSRG